jgi:hypothetical protein
MTLEMFKIVISPRMRWQAKRGVLLGSVFAYAKNNYDMQGIVPHTPRYKQSRRPVSFG